MTMGTPPGNRVDAMEYHGRVRPVSPILVLCGEGVVVFDESLGSPGTARGHPDVTSMRTWSLFQ